VTIIDRQLVGERPDNGAGFVFPYRVTCDFENEGWGCSFDEVFYTLSSATWAEGHHEHFKTYQQRRYNFLSIAEQYWIELDSVIDKLKEPIQGDPSDVTWEQREEALVLKGRASGLAFAIMRACTPYYDTEKDVSIEANRRWKMRNGQLDWAPTLGFKYSPPPAGRREQPLALPDEPVRVQTRKRTQTAGEAAAAKLSPATRDAIKKGIASGMFQPADLAKVYNTTVEVVSVIAQQ